MKLVELYIFDTYAGLHTLDTAKRLIWRDRGFCYFDKKISEERFQQEQDIDTLNSWMKHGKIIPINLEA